MNRKHKLSVIAVCTMLVLTLALLTASFLAPTVLAEGVSFSVPAGVNVPSMTGNTLPPADDFSEDGVNYSFVGWVSEEVGSKTASKPAVYEAGATYDAGMGTKLHALYSFKETQQAWTLVTSSSTALAADDQIIIAAAGYDCAISTNQKSNNRGQADITKDGSTATLGADVQILTVGAGTVSGTFAFNTGSGYLYAASSSSNYLKTQTTLNANGSWKITVGTDGVASIVAQGTNSRNTLRYNSDDSLFACYASDKASNQKDLCIYRSESSSVTYYQTFSCEHKNSTEHTVLEATCTATGVKELRCDSCQAILETITVDMIDHNYIDGSCTECSKIDHAFFDYSGRYVIAAKRSDDNYYFMTNDLGAASTKRYTIVKSGYSESNPLPASISGVDGNVFVIVKNADNETYKIYAEGVDGNNKYLGWTSGNSGTLVSEADARDVYVVKQENGSFHIYFYKETDLRQLSCNNASGNDYFAWYTGTQINDLSLIPVVDASEEEPEEVKTGFFSANVSLGADLTMNYAVTLAEGENIADYSVRFTMNGNVLTVAECEKISDKYVFTFAGIAPQCAGDNILAELIKNGEVVDTKDNYSVLANVTSILNKEDTTEKTKTLIADLLNYCAAAQEYVGYKSDAPVNAGLTVSGSDVTPEDDNGRSVTESTADGVEFTAAGVRFDSINQAYAKFKANRDGITVTVNGERAEIIDLGGGTYAVYSKGISAKNFGTKITFALSVEGEVVQTLVYSVNSYAYAKWDGSTAMNKLALALYRYGVSAANYEG